MHPIAGHYSDTIAPFTSAYNILISNIVYHCKMLKKTFVSGAPAVILVCQGETFDPSPSFKINIAETVSGKERKCCSKMILSVTAQDLSHF